MTLLTPETTEGPRTHAIVIAVGHYPYLRNGEDPRFPGMADLESPPISAFEFASWFLDEYENPSAPRGTLDMYVSVPNGPALWEGTPGKSVAIEPADKMRVTAGIERWAERVDQDTDDIALFFFCGHGVAVGTHNGLLLEDFNHHPKALFRNALDIDGLRDAMDICRARRQVYFSDACRNTPSGIEDAVAEHGIGDSVLTARRKKAHHGRLNAPIFYSALSGQPAYGRPGKSSAFTAALLETLRRGAAVKEGGAWQIRTRRMYDSLVVHLKRICRIENLPFAAASMSDGGDFELHNLTQLPKVPVVVGCNPAAANAKADLAYVTYSGMEVPRPARASELWDVEVDADRYEFKAVFVDGAFKNRTSVEIVQHPGADVQLNV